VPVGRRSINEVVESHYIENEGRVPTEELLGEVLSLDQFDEALLLLKRQHPKCEAIRVAIKYC
jgi:hypothetical protein